MVKFRKKNSAYVPRITQENASGWDVLLLSFKIAFKRLNFWIRPNIWYLLLSIPLVTAPGAKAAMMSTVGQGLRDPGESRVDPRSEMKAGFSRFFRYSLGLSLIKFAGFAVIGFSIYFWVFQEQLYFRVISILAFYGLVLWWLAMQYIYPVLIDTEEPSVIKVIKRSFSLSLKNPFQTLLLAVVNLLLLLFGIILLGPVLLIIPVLRAILSMHFYWFITGQVIPGFMEVSEYLSTYKNEVN